MKLISRIASLCLIVSALTCNLAIAADTDTEDADYYELLKTFAETYEQIERNYVKEVDRKQLMEAAIQGMLQELDRYSNYIPPEQLTQFNESMQQEFGGIGIQVDIDDKTGRLIVISPLPGTPAFRGGVKAGDLIMEIEGKSTEGFTIRDAQDILKGRPGEAVSIGVLHKGEEDVTTVPLVRELIQMQTVLGYQYKDDASWDFMLDKEHKIGFIRLTHFSSHTADELRKALDDLKDEGVKALILDLRFNPGGLLTQAIEISDMFVEEGTIVSTKGRNSPDRSWSAHKEGTFEDIPMVVLINRYSASASEILSACLQDHDRATIIGERSWGKGSVQNVIPLDGEKSALKLTTASYHRPSGKNIHRFKGAKEDDEWGVMPDEHFKHQMSPPEIRDYFEDRRARDVLDGEAGPPEPNYEDPHLKLALDHLTDILAGGDGIPEEKPESETKPEEKKTAKDADSPKTEEAGQEK
ncbi:MAG: S41 family peptidase [Planctomycetaceae bacterium]|nr:S41 family peptidase [Planctomycetaceae bacterium]